MSGGTERDRRGCQCGCREPALGVSWLDSIGWTYGGQFANTVVTADLRGYVRRVSRRKSSAAAPANTSVLTTTLNSHVGSNAPPASG
jgi:hypothetical protein